MIVVLTWSTGGQDETDSRDVRGALSGHHIMGSG